MKTGCLVITHMGIKAELRRRPDLNGKDLILYSGERLGYPLVFDVSQNITNISRGMPLTEAVSRYSGAVIMKADIRYYTRLFARIVSDLKRMFSHVEEDGLGKVYFNMIGVDNMYGGEVKAISRVLNMIPEFFQARAGIASTKFVSYIAAISSQINSATKVSGHSSEIATFLAPFSVDMLPVSQKVISDFKKFGISTIGDLTSHDLNHIGSRFGVEAYSAWQLASGNSFSPVVTKNEENNVSECISLPFESNLQEIVFTAIDILLKRLYDVPPLKGKYASEFVLRCDLYKNTTWVKNIVTREPVSTPSSALLSIRNILGEFDLPGFVERVSLTVSGFSNEHGTQSRIFSDHGDSNNEYFDQLINVDKSLQMKMAGAKSIYRIMVIDDCHPIPEMRAIQVPLSSNAPEDMKALNLPIPVVVKESKGLPVSVFVSPQGELDIEIEDIWKIDFWWMVNPVRRIYYSLRLDNDETITVFKDAITTRWYCQNY